MLSDSVVSTDRFFTGAIKEASFRDISLGVAQSNTLPENIPDPLVYVRRICGRIGGKGPSSVVASAAARQSSDSLLLVSDCVEEELEELRGVDFPFSMFMASPHLLQRGVVLRTMSVRGEPEVRSCELDFADPLAKELSQCLNDGMGAQLKAYTLEYAPFVNLPENSTSAEFSGYIVDFWNTVARLANISYKIEMEPSGHWGQFPKQDGFFNESSGLIGRTLRDEIDVPFSTWAPILSRSLWTDFTFANNEAKYFCFTDKKNLKSGDLFFQARPFSRNSWLLIFVLHLMPLSLGRVCSRFGCPSTSKTFFLVQGILFTILHGFYSGALTMFSVYTPDMPFSNIVDIAVSNSWSVILPKGEEVVFQRFYDQKEPKAMKADQKYNSDEYRKKQPENSMDGLLRLQTVPNSVLYISEQRFFTALQNALSGGAKGVDPQGLLRFCQPNRDQGAIMLPKGSPFKRILNRAIVRMYENGQLEQMKNTWFRKSHIGSNMDDVPSISLRQVAVSLLLMITAALISTGAFVFENFFRKRQRQ